jgi:hypothetical protein
MPDLAILYEHPSWFEPLFAALTRRGIDYLPIHLSGDMFDPAARDVPAPVVLSRVAMSSFLREPEHGIFYAQSLLAHWAARGARVLNGADVIALDASKARQLSLIAGLGLAVPDTRVVHRPDDLVAAARTLAYPLLVKANIGGSGAGIVRYGSEEELAASVRDGSVPDSIDKVCSFRIMPPPAAARSRASRRWVAASCTQSRSKRAVTISTSARPMPAWPHPAGPRRA